MNAQKNNMPFIHQGRRFKLSIKITVCKIIGVDSFQYCLAYQQVITISDLYLALGLKIECFGSGRAHSLRNSALVNRQSSAPPRVATKPALAVGIAANPLLAGDSSNGSAHANVKRIATK